MSDISFNTACKELKIAQIAQLNQLFQLLHLAHIYSHCFYKVSRMLMSKNVNNDVSKDSPIKTENEEFTAEAPCCRQNLKFEDFTLSFGRDVKELH